MNKVIIKFVEVSFTHGGYIRRRTTGEKIIETEKPIEVGKWYKTDGIEFIVKSEVHNLDDDCIEYFSIVEELKKEQPGEIKIVSETHEEISENWFKKLFKNTK